MAKIKGLTSIYVRDIETRIRAYELILINKSCDFDVETKISKDIKSLEEYVGKLSAEQLAYFEYWKYRFYMFQGKEKEAFSSLKKAVDSGNVDAIAQYAYYYSTGTGIVSFKRWMKAKQYFERAFERCDNSMFVEYLYAEAMLSNKDSENEKRKAVEYYKKALAKGVLEARYKLACLYIDLRENLIEAERLLRECNEPKTDIDKKISEIRKIQWSRK